MTSVMQQSFAVGWGSGAQVAAATRRHMRVHQAPPAKKRKPIEHHAMQGVNAGRTPVFARGRIADRHNACACARAVELQQQKFKSNVTPHSSLRNTRCYQLCSFHMAGTTPLEQSRVRPALSQILTAWSPFRTDFRGKDIPL